MQTNLAPEFKNTADGRVAEAILRKCVHCGFCTATCPTYQLLGDELDGPRGRIYLIKQVLEGAEPTERTQRHLDRCLTCRNCETTCPSGVEYGHLLDIGAAGRRPDARPLAQRLLRGALREADAALAVRSTMRQAGLRPMLPASCATRCQNAAAGRPGASTRARFAAGGWQPAMMPRIDAATIRVLDAIGVQAVFAPGTGCCGAIRQHLNDHEGALADARRNLDAWLPLLDAGTAEALLINASGCGAMIKDYAHLLRDDPVYGPRAERLVAATFDLAQWLPREFAAASERAGGLVRQPGASPVVFHPPCTLQHGQQLRGGVEQLLASLGVTVQPVADAHLCCGSAGTYSVLQPGLSQQLLRAQAVRPAGRRSAMVLSANIGCIAHLQGGTDTPVRHWIEWLDEAIA
jgi:glycolate oxidase iron-sulfur subunit